MKIANVSPSSASFHPFFPGYGMLCEKIAGEELGAGTRQWV